jgi:cell division protein FtsI/penicillin-binding protein 2
MSAMRAKRKNKKSTGSRLLCLGVLFLVWMVAIIWKLAWLQVSHHDYYRARAEAQRSDVIQISPLRGDILDRRGQHLAISNQTDSVFVYTREIKDAQKISRTLAPLLGLNEGELNQKLSYAGNRFIWLRRKLDANTATAVTDALARFKLDGVHLAQEPQRFYPHKALAAHALGYVNIDEVGLAGLELIHNEKLRGKSGLASFEVDGLRRPIDRRDDPASNGADIETTIDATLQHQVESIIQNARNATRAKSISAIVLDPQTGEILALANAPDFDPNVRPKRSNDQDEETVRRNRAITDVYEPGSVFKIVTYSGVIEENLVRPDDKVDCQGGQITLHGRTIRDSHPGTGVLTVSDALAKSSNVGAIRMAMKLGEKRLADYVAKFGFGRKTGIDLPGEVSGLVNPLKNWHGTSFASIAMGHEVGVTALQAVAAMGTIANGGVWIQPHVVRRLIAEDGSTIYEPKIETRRVISQQTAGALAGMLEAVVTRGTGRRVTLAGYQAAGKTGTAQKVLPGGGYSNSKFVASFAGFLPVSNPRFAIIVVVDEPVGAHQGGQVAAPIFSEIAEAAIAAYPPQTDRQQIAQAAAKTTPEAVKKLQPETKPEKQEPKAEIATKKTEAKNEVESETKTETKNREIVVSRADSVASVTQSRLISTSLSSGVMPDLRGRSLRAVTQACAGLELKLKVTGSGVAARQFPAPGARVRPGEVCRVEFQ